MSAGTGGVFHDPRPALHERDEMRVSDTHGLARWSSFRLVLDSTGLGWRDAYMSLAVESPWAATLPALPHYSLAYCGRRSARITRRVDGAGVERAQLGTRQFGMIPADRASTWQLDGDPEIELVYVRRETLDELAVEAFGVDPERVHIEPKLGFDDPLLEQLVKALLDTAARDRVIASSGLWADHLIRTIGMQMLRAHSNLRGDVAAWATPSKARIAAARDFIEANLGDDLSLARIASAARLPAHRLTREFRAELGVTPHQYVIGRRVERAAARLRSSDDAISAIAVESGFASQSHLTTAFRRHYGTTPAAYRAVD